MYKVVGVVAFSVLPCVEFVRAHTKTLWSETGARVNLGEVKLREVFLGSKRLFFTLFAEVVRGISGVV